MKRKVNKEITIAKTENFRLYIVDNRYLIEYADADPMKPIPWYTTLEGAKEALYYAGCIDSKTAELS